MSTAIQMDQRAINAREIHEPPANPNVVSPEQQLELERAIRTHGFQQPPLVRPMGDGEWFEIIDGVHRVRAARAVYGDDCLIPCVVVDVDDSTAVQLQIGLNRMRGTLDQSEVGRLVASILDDVSKSDLAIGYSTEEIDQILALNKRANVSGSDFGAVGDLDAPTTTHTNQAPEVEAPAVFPLEIRFTTSADQKRARRALRYAAGGSEDYARGLLKIIDGQEDK